MTKYEIIKEIAKVVSENVIKENPHIKNVDTAIQTAKQAEKAFWEEVSDDEVVTIPVPEVAFVKRKGWIWSWDLEKECPKSDVLFNLSFEEFYNANAKND